MANATAEHCGETTACERRKKKGTHQQNPSFTHLFTEQMRPGACFPEENPNMKPSTLPCSTGTGSAAVPKPCPSHARICQGEHMGIPSGITSWPCSPTAHLQASRAVTPQEGPQWRAALAEGSLPASPIRVPSSETNSEMLTQEKKHHEKNN